MTVFTSNVFVIEPDLALLIVLLGALGICAEFLRPGSIFPGVLGSALVMIGFAALTPLDWRGLALLTLAFPLLWADARNATRGALTALGAVLSPCGVLLMQPRIDGWAALMTVPFALAVSFLFSIAVRAKRNKSA